MKTPVCSNRRHAVRERLQAVVMPSVLLLAGALLFTGCAHTQSADTVSTLSRTAPYGGTQGARYSEPSSARRLPATVNSSNVARGDKTNIVDIARSAIGTRYRFGGTSPETGLDCSGLVCWVYEQVGVSVPRQAKEQLLYGQPVGRSSLKPGDIVVFKSPRSRSGWHSGIYSGNGMFVHSPSSGKSVTESSIYEDYYANRFMGAARLISDSGRPLADIGSVPRRQPVEQSRMVASASPSPVKAKGVATGTTSAKAEKAAAVTKKGTASIAKKSDKKQVVARSKPAGKRSANSSSKSSSQKTLLKASVNKKAQPASPSAGKVKNKTAASNKAVALKGSAGKVAAAGSAKQNKNASAGKRTLSDNKSAKTYSSKQTGKRGS